MELLKEKWSLHSREAQLDGAPFIKALSGAAGPTGRTHHVDLQTDVPSTALRRGDGRDRDPLPLLPSSVVLN